MLTIMSLLLQSTTSTLERSSVTLLVGSSSNFLVESERQIILLMKQLDIAFSLTAFMSLLRVRCCLVVVHLCDVVV
ncbi:hypothetical protein PHAVU_003G087200 [Phaseolus vulgaris]|uniref:Uncharacterized protein n=1 Tax=Phaseolus vulgaris TaxID=3885 RepID=V7C7C8_PHAVU|nr:hypothetical protein PHAVU_003G087200g [Phaseolus vulgaris]ESW26049.1 hypothetical protein PHAVU_003G087200g [Phaseolus vulgaris]